MSINMSSIVVDQDFGLCDAVNVPGETDNSRCEAKGICSCFPCHTFLELLGRYPAPVRVGRLREKRVTMTHHKSKLHCWWWLLF